MKLLYSDASPYARKVRVVLAEKRIDCELVAVTPPYEIAKHNPLGKVPTLLLDDGSSLYDSRVIVDFLDNVSPISRLIPDDHRDRTMVRRWEALADGILDAALLVRQESQRASETADGAAWISRQMEKIRNGLAAAEHDLAGHQWCHNERYTLADIALGCCLGYLNLRRPGGIDWAVASPGLANHYSRMLDRPSFSESSPE